MKIFQKLYDKALIWSRHRHAPRYLSGLSFAESSFFPIPPDVMLAPMSLAQPKKAWYFAFLTTLFSVLGGVLGYLIGYLAFEPVVKPILEYFNAMPKFDEVQKNFNMYGVWIVFAAGFTFIPYKIFTITAGVMTMNPLGFIIASLVGRGARFYLVAGAMVWGGQRLENALRRNIDIITWVTIILLVALYFYLKNG